MASSPKSSEKAFYTYPWFERTRWNDPQICQPARCLFYRLTRVVWGATWAPWAGSGTEPQPKLNL